jgi:hypothetical protein
MLFVATKKMVEPQKNYPSLVLLLDPGWIKIRIRDKHPGSATLKFVTDEIRCG